VKAAPFEYRRPASLGEALELLAQHGDECKPLAGGQSLIPLLAMRLARPAVLADLQGIPELRRRESIRIGAMVTNAELEEADPDTVPPLVAAALPHIGHYQIRSRGTVGGNLAHADPAGEWPALAVALDAVIVTRSLSRGTKEIAAADFFLGPLNSALEPDDLLIELRVPAWAFEAKWAFAEIARRPGDFAIAGTAAVQPPVGRLRVVVFAVGPSPQLVDPESPTFEVTGDVHASTAYRREAGKRLIERALAEIAS
jgi:carbon-monoxide dehydrogenase medium subunit